MIYLIGSLSNTEVPKIANQLRAALNIDVFDDWYGAGKEADWSWGAYERARGRTLAQAVKGRAAQNTFLFDWRHLQQAHTVVLVLPAGKSAHMELGWAAGRGKRTAVLVGSDPEKWDVMYALADIVVHTTDELVETLRRAPSPPRWTATTSAPTNTESERKPCQHQQRRMKWRYCVCRFRA